VRSVVLSRCPALSNAANGAEARYEPLAEAPPAPPKPLGANELRKFVKLERQMLRELRIFLREILGRLVRDRRFLIFSKPVDPQEVVVRLVVARVEAKPVLRLPTTRTSWRRRWTCRP